MTIAEFAHSFPTRAVIDDSPSEPSQEAVADYQQLVADGFVPAADVWGEPTAETCRTMEQSYPALWAWINENAS